MSASLSYPDLLPLLGDAVEDIRGRLIPNQLLSAVTCSALVGLRS